MGARLLLVVAIVLLGGPFGRSAIPAEIIKDSVCLECHSDKTLTKTNAAGKQISLFVDVAKLSTSAHKTNSCASCHSDITVKHPDDNLAAKPIDCRVCHERQTESYGASVHGLASKAGRADSASCQDCHDSHEVLPPSSPASPLYFSRQTETCGQCHDQQARDVAASVHGQATAGGKRDAPTCTDCHSEHKIEGLKTSSPLKIASEVCSKCHASERLNTKFNLPSDRVRTFFESYHGLAAQYGSTLAANCGSCHGYHKILPSKDPASTIHQSHLVETCGKCHPGANEKFAFSKVHIDNSAAQSSAEFGSQVNWWVRKAYLVLIFTVIGAMLLHNGLLFARKLRVSRLGQDRPILRMNCAQRWQHFILGLSFTVLAVSGFALKFPDSWIARLLGSNEPLRRWTHRIAGVVLLAVGAYHLVYLLVTQDGRKLVKDFFPGIKDVKDVLGAFRFLFGLSPNKPRFGRFGYAEKMEYWAVIWGTIIMGVTGLMLWLKLDVTRFLPRWALDVATTIHYYEAILACLAIIVWHFYHVIFDPDVYPVNWACWDGRVSEHWQQEEHPLEVLPPTNESDLTREPAADLARADDPALALKNNDHRPGSDFVI
jgi:formate dehydrogenase gamma subunit